MVLSPPPSKGNATQEIQRITRNTFPEAWRVNDPWQNLPGTNRVTVPTGGSYVGQGSGGGEGGTYVDPSGHIISAGRGSTVGSSSPSTSGYQAELNPAQQQAEAARQQAIIQSQQRAIALAKMGVITRVSQDANNITYYGTFNESYTFPKNGLRYSGADKPGGIPSRENPYGSNTLQAQAETFRQRVAMSFGEKIIFDLGKRTGYQVEKKGGEYYFWNDKLDNRIYSRMDSSNKDIYVGYQEAKKKIPLYEKIMESSRKEKGSLLGISEGIIGTAIYSGQEAIGGFFSVFNPKTYINLFGAVTHLRETREQIYGLGKEIYQNPEVGFGVVSSYWGFGKGIGFLGKGFQTINKLNPSYISSTSTNIKIVEDVTIPTSLKALKSFEGERVPTIHTTFSKELKSGTIIEQQSEGASGWRANVGQLNFYSSSPLRNKIGYTPTLYGGYIGIGEGYSSSFTSTEFSLFPKRGNALIFRDTLISKTPDWIGSRSLKQVVNYQTTTPGTFIAAENIKGASIEGQFTTSSGLKDSPFFKLSKNPLGELEGKFTYYNLKKQIPNFLGGEKSFIKPTWDLFTSENKKIKFQEVKFELINKLPKETNKKNVLKIEDYSDSFNKKYLSLSESGKGIGFYKGSSGSIFSSALSFSISSISSISNSSLKSSSKSIFSSSSNLSSSISIFSSSKLFGVSSLSRSSSSKSIFSSSSNLFSSRSSFSSSSSRSSSIGSSKILPPYINNNSYIPYKKKKKTKHYKSSRQFQRTVSLIPEVFNIRAPKGYSTKSEVFGITNRPILRY
jgi:hypothetical protein